MAKVSGYYVKPQDSINARNFFSCCVIRDKTRILKPERNSPPALCLPLYPGNRWVNSELEVSISLFSLFSFFLGGGGGGIGLQRLWTSFTKVASLERPNCFPHCRSPLHIFSFLERFAYSFSAGVWQNTERVNVISWVFPREWDIRCRRPIHGSMTRGDAWLLKLSFSRLAKTSTPDTLPKIPSREQEDCSDGMYVHNN